MNKKKEHIDKKFLSQEDIIKYREGTLSYAEQHRVEKILLEEGFEAEAMEGIFAVEAKQAEEDLNSLKDQLQVKLKSNEKSIVPVWRIAAAVLLLGFFSVSVYYLLEQPQKDELISLRMGKNDIGKEKSSQTYMEAPEVVVESPVEEEGRLANVEKGSADVAAETGSVKSEKANEQQARINNHKSNSKPIVVENNTSQMAILDQEIIAEPEIDNETEVQPIIAMRKDEAMVDEVMAEDAQPMISMKKSKSARYSKQAPEAVASTYDEEAAIAYPGDKGKESDVNKPMPVGGKPAFNKYIRNNIHYPPEKVDTGIKGTMSVVFVVTAEGKVEQLHIDKSLGSLFDKEAVRLILEGPEWQPAIENNIPVDKEVRVRIRFKPPI